MSDTVYRIFLVEDDSVISEEITKSLTSWGFDAKSCTNLRQVMNEFAAFCPHLVLMDVSLPFFNGYHWCSEIRKASSVPVIFISSAADNMSIVMAMNMGGDDYIAKPFSFDVLTAKIQALLRRSYDYCVSQSLITHRGVILNTSDATLVCMGQKVSLTKNEYRILEILLRNRGKIVSRDELMTRLWESESFIDENTLSVNVARIRKKLDDAGCSDYITTKKGVGYMVE